jgi:hypothetical protein
MGADTAEDTGLDMEQLDRYALVSSEALFILSGKQFRGVRERTIVARVGRSRGTAAKASLGSWWPVESVSDVVGLPARGTARPLGTDEWTWSGGIVLTVPASLAYGEVQALITTGQDPTEFGRMAAIALAAELAVSDPDYSGEEKTRLPAMTTSISRQGISQSFATVLDAVKEGATGIIEVDQFVNSYNPIKARSRPRVRTMR